MSLSEHNDYWSKRGLLEAVQAAGLIDYTYRGEPGWKIPIRNAAGDCYPDSYHWKALRGSESNAGKYLWFNHPDKAKYYFMTDIKAAVAAAGGELHLMAGEPDVWTLWQMGCKNATSFFGENQIPDSLIDDLEYMGVSHVIYYADNDETGRDVAQLLNDQFSRSLIQFTCKVVPYPYNDLNDWYVACEFDREKTLSLQTLTFKEQMTEIAPPEGKGRLDVPVYRAAITSALGAEYKRAGDKWSKKMRCIFASHEHDDRNPAAQWNEQTGYYRCFKCQGADKTADEVAAHIGVNVDDYRTLAFTERTDAPPAKTETAAAVPPEQVIYSSTDAVNRLIGRLTGVVKADALPIINPITQLHHLGGFARLLKPGKMIGILGLSGGGKTSFIESMYADPFRQMGLNGLWWGPEWSYDEYADRALQRYSSITTNDIALHELWLEEQRLRDAGKPASKYGVKLDDKVLNDAVSTLYNIADWSGKLYYVEKMDASLETLLAIKQAKITELAQQGIHITYDVWDYVQLLDVTGARSDRERIQTAMRKIKAFTTDNKLITFVTSQPTKASSKEARGEDNIDEYGNVEGLGSDDAQLMRDWEFNLFMTLQPARKEGKLLDFGGVNVTKNSQGKTGNVRMMTEFSRLRWLDQGVKRDIIDISAM